MSSATELWTYPEELGRLDVTGFDVEAVDGKAGTVDDASYDVGTSFMVVDTGTLVFGKKTLVPAGLIDHVDRDTETVHVARTKNEIKNAPEYDADRVGDPDHWARVADHYDDETRGDGKLPDDTEER